MENTIKLIEAISTILWPITTLIIIFIFKSSIAKLIARIQKGKVLGNEFEFGTEVRKFESSVNKAKEENPYSFEFEKDDKYVDILNKSVENPEIGILMVSAELERKIKQIFALTGLSNSHSHNSLIQSFDILEKSGYVTKNTINSLKIFRELRNKIAHGITIEKSNNIVGMLDTGIGLLKIVDSIPHEKNFVYKFDVPIFKDENCTIPYEKGKAIILESHSSNGVNKFKRVFPTMQTNYKIGMQLTWEWSFKNKWDEAFYIDPDTKEKKPAWSSSAEYIGRDVKKV